jgi:uncharacterized short protein YbdD (DUF466 family)
MASLSATILKEAMASFGKCVCDSARLMIGVPDYETYVAHLRLTHPDQPVMTYAEFFRERQGARYGDGSGRGFRCC